MSAAVGHGHFCQFIAYAFYTSIWRMSRAILGAVFSFLSSLLGYRRGIFDHVRRRLARFKLGAHFLNLRRLLVQTRSKLRFEKPFRACRWRSHLA